MVRLKDGGPRGLTPIPPPLHFPKGHVGQGLSASVSPAVNGSCWNPKLAPTSLLTLRKAQARRSKGLGVKQAPWGLGRRRMSFQPVAHPPSPPATATQPPPSPTSPVLILTYNRSGKFTSSSAQLAQQCPSPTFHPFRGWVSSGTPPPSLLLLISWVPPALSCGAVYSLFFPVLTLSQSEDVGQLFYCTRSSGQHIPSKPRVCILASQLNTCGYPAKPQILTSDTSSRTTCLIGFS